MSETDERRPARISLIVAVADNGVIGRRGALPWHLSSDLKRFREITMAKPVIMGRKTFEAIEKPLDGRENIVVTQVSKLAYKGVWTVESVEDALDFGHRLAEEMSANEIMVIGGAQIYDALVGRADRIYMTEVHASPDGDATMVALEPDAWIETAREDQVAGERDDHDMTFVTLDRR